MKPLRTRIAVAHQAAQALEAASDAEWRLLDRYLATFRDRPRPMPRWLALRSDVWWRLVQAGNRARDRFGALVCQEVAEAGSFSSSEGGPVVRRVDVPLPASSSVAEALSELFGSFPSSSLPHLDPPPCESSAHRSPIRDDGPPPEEDAGRGLASTPSDLEDLASGSTSRQAAAHAPDGVAALPPSPLAEIERCPPGRPCQLCDFLDVRVLGRRGVA